MNADDLFCVSTGRATLSPAEGAAAELYDFRNPSKFTRDHLRIMEQIAETYADQAATQLSSRLRVPCSQDFESLQQQTYGAYIASLPDQTALLVASLPPLDSAGLIHLPLPMAMLSVELQLGGTGEDEQPSRGLTDIEWALVSDAGKQLIEALRYSFDGTIDWHPTFNAHYASPELAHAASVGDQMLVLNFRLEIKEQVFRPTLVLPLTPILPFLDGALAARRAARSTQDQERFAKAVEQRVRTAPVPVSIRLRPTSGRLADFTDIAVGDVFRIGHSVNAPWEVASSGVIFAHGVPGSDGGRVAVRIVGSGRE